jgi:hypothetical protein
VVAAAGVGQPVDVRRVDPRAAGVERVEDACGAVGQAVAVAAVIELADVAGE